MNEAIEFRLRPGPRGLVRHASTTVLKGPHDVIQEHAFGDVDTGEPEEPTQPPTT